MSKFKVEVTSRKAPRAGQRKARRRAAAIEGRRSWGGLVFGVIAWLLKRSPASWAWTAVLCGAVVYGTPHLLVTYRCSIHSPEHCTSCSYFGVQGMRSHLSPPSRCPVIVFLPINWAALAAQFTSE